jgi:hypothetical protein
MEIAMFDATQNQNHRYIPELAICGVLMLLSLCGMIWYETTGLLKHDIDGLLLVSICLLIGTIFSVQFVLIARNAEWIKFPGRHRTKAAALSSTLQQAHPMHAGGQLAGRLK